MSECAALQFFVTMLCLFTLCLPQRELPCRLFSHNIIDHVLSLELLTV